MLHVLYQSLGQPERKANHDKKWKCPKCERQLLRRRRVSKKFKKEGFYCAGCQLSGDEEVLMGLLYPEVKVREERLSFLRSTFYYRPIR